MSATSGQTKAQTSATSGQTDTMSELLVGKCVLQVEEEYYE